MLDFASVPTFASRKMLWAALAGVAILAAYFLPRRQSTETPPPRESGAEYVDPVVCAGCHQQIAKTYRATGMGRSFYRPRPDNTREDYHANSLYHPASGRYYTMVNRDGKYYQRRHQLGFDGKQTNVMERAVDFVIGSGNHARTYLSRTADGKLVELPVSWYAGKGGYWAMSPGYDRPDQQDFRRVVGYDDECLFCHNGYPPAGKIGEPREGIDCQRCHGPGSAHVEAAGSGRATVEAIRGAIVNPAKLSRDRQLEVCMQCHLETTSRRLPHAIRRYDRATFSFRPGEPLGDYSIAFDHAPGTGHDDKFEIAHAAYRLRKSACFLESQMTCLTCHNPHEAGAAAEHYTAVCRNCHATLTGPDHTPQALSTAACVDCHMPKRRTQDAVHVVMTDHYIQRRKPAGDLLAPLTEPREAEATAYRGEVALYYPPKLPAEPKSELYLALAQVDQAANLTAGIPRLQKAIEQQQPANPEFYFELGEAYSKAGNPEESIRWFDEALRRRPEFVPAIKEKTVALLATGRAQQAADLLEKGVALAPNDAVLLTDLGNVYLQQGKLAPALNWLNRAAAANPDLPEARNLLGLAHLQQGDRTTAEKDFREAIRLQPDLAIAHNNLANLLAAARDYAQARYHFEKAIANDPGYAEAHHSYGLLLALTRSYDKAIAELRETVRLAPNSAQAHSSLADVLNAKGLLQNAVLEYQRAVELKPDLFEAHLALGQILDRQGRKAEARAHYEKASESPDPELRQAARQAMR